MAYGPDYQSGAGKSDAWRKREMNKLIKELKNNWDIVQKETFAPILYIMKYKNMDDAIFKHNNVLAENCR